MRPRDAKSNGGLAPCRALVRLTDSQSLEPINPTMDDAGNELPQVSGEYRSFRYVAKIVGDGPYRGSFSIEGEAPDFGPGRFIDKGGAMKATKDLVELEIEGRLSGLW